MELHDGDSAGLKSGSWFGGEAEYSDGLSCALNILLNIIFACFRDNLTESGRFSNLTAAVIVGARVR